MAGLRPMAEHARLSTTEARRVSRRMGVIRATGCLRRTCRARCLVPMDSPATVRRMCRRHPAVLWAELRQVILRVDTAAAHRTPAVVEVGALRMAAEAVAALTTKARLFPKKHVAPAAAISRIGILSGARWSLEHWLVDSPVRSRCGSGCAVRPRTPRGNSPATGDDGHQLCSHSSSRPMRTRVLNRSLRRDSVSSSARGPSPTMLPWRMRITRSISGRMSPR